MQNSSLRSHNLSSQGLDPPVLFSYIFCHYKKHLSIANTKKVKKFFDHEIFSHKKGPAEARPFNLVLVS